MNKDNKNDKGNSINTSACSFTVDRELSNAKTIAAIEEVQHLKVTPNKKTYSSFEELLVDLDNE